jgi:hypothetical protein
MFDVEPYYNVPMKCPKHSKPRRETCLVCCAICHSSRVTLLKREGAYVCRPCYQKLLTLRTLEKQQQKERAEI